MNIQPLILAGGVGSRLWPLSRESYPKQFISLRGEHTLLQNTLLRVKEISSKTPIIVTNNEYRFIVADQVKKINCDSKIILEPIGRNTAPAITVASFLSDPDDILLVLSSDSYIKDTSKFIESIKNGYKSAKEGSLVTFGANPEGPNTGFGYIKKGKKENEVYKVDKFIEKPSFERAVEFCKSDNYLWNCGIFMFKTKNIQNEIKAHNVSIYSLSEEVFKNLEEDLGFLRIDINLFKKCIDISIDHCVFEHTKKATVALLETKWDDLGTWKSIRDINEKDESGNAILSKSVLSSTRDSLLFSKNRVIATHGINDMVVVDSKDSVLVAKIGDSDGIKKIVSELKEREWSEAVYDKEVHRPWGKYESLFESPVCQVKILTVSPNQKLSVQSHKYRSEHWVVIKGKALVQIGDDEFELNVNESTYINVGDIHSLANPYEDELEIIEVQTGTYFGEDDIVRYDDIYGRDENE
tara:strand:+ start:160 stop:1563 length:1404 start_codon:yes stop_codon:yes gene_type:complete